MSETVSEPQAGTAVLDQPASPVTCRDLHELQAWADSLGPDVRYLFDSETPVGDIREFFPADWPEYNACMPGTAKDWQDILDSIAGDTPDDAAADNDSDPQDAPVPAPEAHLTPGEAILSREATEAVQPASEPAGTDE